MDNGRDINRSRIHRNAGSSTKDKTGVVLQYRNGLHRRFNSLHNSKLTRSPTTSATERDGVDVRCLVR